MLNLRFAFDYLKHRLTAKTRHGLHSPFVYRLVDEVIYDFSVKKVYQQTAAAGKKLPPVSTSAKLMRLLYRLAAWRQPETIIQLGGGLGTITLYLHLVAPDAPVYILEGATRADETVIRLFAEQQVNNIFSVAGSYDEALRQLIGRLPKLDLVYIDGNHQKKALLCYFDWCLPKVNESSMLIFNDIYRNQDMKDAWIEIKAHPQVTVTVDLFWMGLVFFRKGQVKEDFKVRF